MKTFQSTSRLNRLKQKLVSVVAATLAITSITATSIHAGLVGPGDSVALTGTTVSTNPDLAGVVRRDSLLPFEIRNGSGAVILTGSVQDRVVRSNNRGTLIFAPRLRNLSNPGAVAWIVGMKVTGYDGATIDVEYSSLGSGDVGPGKVTRSGGTGNELLFDHDPQIIVPPNEQRFLNILSTATDFVLNGEITIYATQAIGGDIFSTTISDTAVPSPYYVVCPGGSIQDAINAASPGDTVSVKAGTYVEDITLRDDIDVVGAGAGVTNLRGTGTTSVVTANNVNDAKFSGFTVENSGTGSTTSGIKIFGGDPLITGNTLRNNRHGMYVYGASSAIICNNRVENNGAPANGVFDYGIAVVHATPLVSNNVVLNNEVGVYIDWADSSGTQIVNNTIVDNADGGIRCTRASATIKNNIVTGGNEGIHATFSAATPTLTYNNVWGNTTNYVSSNTGVATAGTGSISADPMFDALTPGAYQLDEGSPCLDAGDPSAIYNDLDGSRNDIGAYGGPCAREANEGGARTNGFLFTSVGKLPTNFIGTSSGLANVPTADAGSLYIPNYMDAPFGGHLWLYGAFGRDERNVTQYTIEIAKWDGTSRPTVADFAPVDDPLNKIYFSVGSGGVVTATNRSAGPNVHDGVPYYQRTDNATSGGYWAHENVAIVLNTRELEDGKYDIKLRGFNTAYNEVLNGTSNVLTLEINNKKPAVTINSVRNEGTLVPECAVINLSSPTANLVFRISAEHPDGFMHNYSFTANVGRNRSAGTITSDNYANNFGSRPVWNGINNRRFNTSAAMTAGTLNPWETCAYQFKVRAWARTTDGNKRIYHHTFFENFAINLTGGTGGTGADLDGDGDVDGDDLVIFSEAFGSE